MPAAWFAQSVTCGGARRRLVIIRERGDPVWRSVVRPWRQCGVRRWSAGAVRCWPAGASFCVRVAEPVRTQRVIAGRGRGRAAFGARAARSRRAATRLSAARGRRPSQAAKGPADPAHCGGRFARRVQSLVSSSLHGGAGAGSAVRGSSGCVLSDGRGAAWALPLRDGSDTG